MVKGLSFSQEIVNSCPFCGCEDLSFKTHNETAWIECGDCYAKGPTNELVEAFLEKSEGNAIDDWNERDQND